MAIFNSYFDITRPGISFIMNLLKSLELHPQFVRNGTRYDPFPGSKLMRFF
jgi:hypothetical protein